MSDLPDPYPDAWSPPIHVKVEGDFHEVQTWLMVDHAHIIMARVVAHGGRDKLAVTIMDRALDPLEPIRCAAILECFRGVKSFVQNAIEAECGGWIFLGEIPSASTKRIKIPDACIGVGVKFMTPFEMLRVERARFVLGADPKKKAP